MACSFAVLMHMRLPEIANYFSETGRVLRTGGRGVITVTAITADDLDAPDPPRRHGRTFMPIGDATWALDPANPSAGLGYERPVLDETITHAGLEIVDFIEGGWHGRRAPDDDQPHVGGDAYIVTPRA